MYAHRVCLKCGYCDYTLTSVKCPDCDHIYNKSKWIDYLKKEAKQHSR